MGENTVKLPNREDMLRRLLLVNESVPFFYPKLLDSAGREKDAHDVVMMFALAVGAFILGYIPRSSIPLIIQKLLFIRIPRFIDALIDDEQFASDAKEHLQKIIDRTRM